MYFFKFQYREYWLRESARKKAANVIICDTMGFEQFDDMKGPSVADIEYIMDGHITTGYEVYRGRYGLLFINFTSSFAAEESRDFIILLWLR